MYERVLIIDDAQEIREFLSEYILKPKGFEVLTASNGLMGLEMAIAKEPDLMIVDQQMPRLTGLEVLGKLRERGIEIPAILATAHGSEETAVAAFRPCRHPRRPRGAVSGRPHLHPVEAALGRPT